MQGTGPAKAYTKSQIMNAATVSLIHRGNGTGPDANSGWEKAWRAAAWAQLGNSSVFYHELSFALHENFGNSLFSLYNPAATDAIFQIDANFGFPAAVMVRVPCSICVGILLRFILVERAHSSTRCRITQLTTDDHAPSCTADAMGSLWVHPRCARAGWYHRRLLVEDG